MIKRLHVHGLIRKIGHACKYYLTKLGSQVITMGLKLKELVIIPNLAGHLALTWSPAFLARKNANPGVKILMPFWKPFDDVYRAVIAPAVRQAGLEVMRADEMFAPGSIMEQIRSAIQQSRLCVADLTGRNPNVLYELGIAQTLGKPCILLTQDIADVPFDIRQYRVIQYDLRLTNLNRAQIDLVRSIMMALGSDRLDEARLLIEIGSVRAGVAILGVLLEQTLKYALVNADLVDVRLRDSFARGLTMGRMLEMLTRAEKISIDDQKKLRRAVQMRNQAVHDLGEPDRAAALQMYSEVADFVRRMTMKAERIRIDRESEAIHDLIL